MSVDVKNLKRLQHLANVIECVGVHKRQIYEIKIYIEPYICGIGMSSKAFTAEKKFSLMFFFSIKFYYKIKNQLTTDVTPHK